jgi:hypothetical protein
MKLNSAAWISSIAVAVAATAALAVVTESAASEKSAGGPALPQFAKEAPYPDARKSLMASGWQPRISRKNVMRDPSDYPETLSCAGTGEGNCLFLWRKGRVTIEVATIDDPPVIVGVRCRAGCGSKAK